MKRHGSLNRIYRLVWSQVTNSWVAVAETARGRGKGKTRQRTLIAAALALAALVTEAQAGPGGGSVVKGSASISQQGQTTTITQSSQDTTINWSSFSIARNETVNFMQPNARSVAINDVIGNSVSQIYGHLNANGEVFLINHNGIVFGRNAEVNVGGLVASALDLSGTTPAAMTFKGAGNVSNEGTIHAGSFAVVLGSSVSNNGSIVAPLGTIVLGAGNAATLTLHNQSGHSPVSLKIDASILNNIVSNGGLIQTDGGAIVLTAGAKNELLASAINNTGVLRACTVQNHNGTISLLADMGSGSVNVGGTIDASAPDGGDGGAITTNGAQVHIAPDARVTTHAASGHTGSWLIDPADFTIAASGGDETGAQVSAALVNNNVTIASSDGTVNLNGSGDINVNDGVSWTSGNALTLNAVNNINVNAGINWGGGGSASQLNLNAQNSININTAMNGGSLAGLALQYAQGAYATSGALNINAPVNLSSNGSFSTTQGATTLNYTIVTSLGTADDVNTGAPTLQGMAASGNLNTYFALGSNIDASATAGWNKGAGFTPIGNANAVFFGAFTGLGHTISGLYINLPGQCRFTCRQHYRTRLCWGLGRTFRCPG